MMVPESADNLLRRILGDNLMNATMRLVLGVVVVSGLAGLIISRL